MIFGNRQKTIWLFSLLVAPVLLLRLATAAYPIGKTFWLSLTDTHLFDNEHAFVGLRNYYHLLSDPDFLSTMFFSFIYIAASTLLELIFGLLIALMLNNKFKGRLFARAINLIPWAIPTIVAAFIFRWFLDDQFGLISHWWHGLTGQHIAFLNTALSAQMTVILVNVWKNASFMAVIFLAGLQGVPDEIYEAARLDGAGAIARFCHITVPMLMPLLITMSMYFLIWQLASFDLVYGLTGGGPGISTEIVPLNIFHEGLIFFKFGYASAVSVVLMAIVAVIGFVGVKQFKRYNYE